MDIKAVIIAICVAMSGFLFYQNQQRSRELFELTKRQMSPADVAAAKNVGGDAELIAAIRAEVMAQLAASGKSGDCKGGLGMGETLRLQELKVQMDELDKKFKVSLDKMLAPDDEEVATRAEKIKKRVVEMCKR